MHARFGQFFRTTLWVAVAAAVGLLGRAPVAWAAPPVQAGPYRVTVTTDPPVLPTTGKATLRVTVKNAAGQPVEGATIRALTKMPGMEMGEREEVGAPVAGQPGVYAVPATFAMSGGYEAALRIDGPQGAATARVPLQTGQNTTAENGGASVPLVPVLLGVALVLVVIFVLVRMRRSGQTIHWRGVFNRQVVGGLALLAVFAAGAVYAVGHWRRPGALTPIEAQAMDMSYLPAPTGVAPVTLTTVTRGAVASTVRYTGTAVGNVEQEVFPRVTGTLTWMPFYAGDRVKKGQLLARLDTSQTQPLVAGAEAEAATARQGVGVARAESEEAEAGVEQAHAELAGKQGALAEAQAQVTAAAEERKNADASVASAEAQVADARAQVESARADQTYWRAQIERSAALLKAGAISGEEYQRDRAQADTADAKVRQAEAQVTRMLADVRAARAAQRRADAQIAAAMARVRMARSELDAHKAHVRSAQAAVNTAGRKIAQARSAARQAQASAQSATATRGYSEIRAETDGVVTERRISPGVLVSPGQAILTVAQIRPIRLQANVAEADLSRIRVGSAVTVRGQDDSRPPVSARVTSIAPAMDPVARTGRVEAVVPNANARFLPGQYVVMEIQTGRETGSLRVPMRAIGYSNERPFVWVAEASGQSGQYIVRRVEIETGVRGAEQTEVTRGLDENLRVVLSGGAYLKDGDRVAVVGEKPAAGDAMASEGDANGVQTANIVVTNSGFEPATVPLRAGVPARLTFTRKTDQTCATEVLIPEHKIKQPLPLNKPVTITFTPHSGQITFACPMDMIKGTVVAQ